MSTARFEQTEIPRHPVYGGPYVIPPGAKRTYGDHECQTCHRMVAPNTTKTGRPSRSRGKGTCKCKYYKRTTTWIDVIQDEYLLKQWGKRNVAWGMSQRPDLVLAAAACKPDSDEKQTKEDKDDLNEIARKAGDHAGDRIKAGIGTSLHKLTHQMDRGEELGFVPERWRDDLKAYAEATKGIEWTWIESFRVHDELQVAGTVDRIGWYRNRFVVADVKTGSDWNEVGFAMQLAMYARMQPYNIATDERGDDPHQVDLNLAWVIKLPEGKGVCKIEPIHIGMGWGACQVAKQVWELRKQKFFMTESEITVGRSLLEMAKNAGSIKECQILWRNGKAMGELTPDVRDALSKRADQLKAMANA